MRPAFALFFLLWAAVLILIAVVKLAQGKTLSDVAAIGFMGLVGIALAVGTWSFLGRQQRVIEETPPQPAAAVEQPKVSAPPAAPIELGQSTGSILSAAAYAVFFLFAAFWLVRYPDTLWTRWLAYPAAVVMVLLAIGAVLLALGRREVRFVADAQGIEVREDPIPSKVDWKQVGAVKLVERRVGRYRSALTNYVGEHLSLQDRAGNELLRLERVGPPDAYRRLLEAIPAWTGLPVQHVTETAGGPRTIPVAPQQAEKEEPRTAPAAEGSLPLLRRMAAHLMTALGAWLGVVVLVSLAGVVFLMDTRYALTTGLLRFGELFWKSLLVVLAVELILWLASFRWMSDEPGPAWFSRAAMIAFGLLPVIVGFLGITSLLRGRDPWEYLPGGPPFALREFASKHPQLHVETVGILGGDVVAVTWGSSPRVIYSEGNLLGAGLRWENCPDAGDPARLGGPPPYPGSRCLARIEIRRPDYAAVSEEDLDRGVTPPEIQDVRYVYSTGSADIAEVKKHFADWAKSIDQELHVYGSNWLEVIAGGKKWTVQIRGVKRSADDVYVEYTQGGAPVRVEDQ